MKSKIDLDGNSAARLQPIVKDLFYLGTSKYIALFFAVGRGLLIPKLLDPSGYGIWKAVSMIADFSRLPQLGTASSMFREIPMLKAKSKTKELNDVIDTAFTVNIASASIIAIGVFLSSFYFHDPRVVVALRIYALLIFLSEFFMFMKIMFSGFKEFVFLGKVNSFDAVLSLAFAVFMTWTYGLNGLIVGTIIELLIIICIFFGKIDRNPKFRINFKLWAYLIRIGFPLMLSGLLFQLLLSVDKIMVLAFLGSTTLGYYVIGLTLMNMVCQGFFAVGSVVSPRLMEEYGKKEQLGDVLSYVTTPILAMSYTAPLFLVGMYFLSDLIYFHYLPNYQLGYNSFRIILLAGYFVIIINGMNSFFTAIKKQAQIVYIQICAISVAFIANYIAIIIGGNIESVAVVTVSVMFIYAVAIINYAISHYMDSYMRRFMFLLKVLLPLIYSLVCLYVIELLLRKPDLTTSTVIQSFLYIILFVIVYTPVLILGYNIVRRNAVILY